MTHLDPKALTPAQKAVWDVIEKRIEQNPVTGISAEGKPNADVEREQRIFQDGMRVARLAAVNALAALPQAEPVEFHVTDRKNGIDYTERRPFPTPAVSREDVIEECAKLVDDVMKAEPPGRSKMMLAIAAKTVRRGRHLTDSEKHANLMRAMREAEAEDAALSQPHSEK